MRLYCAPELNIKLESSLSYRAYHITFGNFGYAQAASGSISISSQLAVQAGSACSSPAFAPEAEFFTTSTSVPSFDDIVDMVRIDNLGMLARTSRLLHDLVVDDVRKQACATLVCDLAQCIQ